ncbi:MAG: hypothetical protein H6R14_763 [Proteobacteria bacterium]|nr:hypothetical protein [Pseudomonadota bacterium]
METVIVIIIGVGCALVGSWSVSKHKHGTVKLPEDIQ